MLSYIFGSGKKQSEENADPELAMREQLDDHGDFKCEMDGTLVFDDFLALRAVIMR
jgi:hypothetical protein